MTTEPDAWKVLYRRVQFLVDESTWGRQGQEVPMPRKPKERGG